MPTLKDLLAGPVAAPPEDAVISAADRAKARNDITRAVARAEALREQLAALSAREQRAVLKANRASQVLSRLREIPELAEIRSVGGRLEFITHPMHCRNPVTRRWHELGRFRIRLPFGTYTPPSGFVDGWCMNITRRPREFGHPHVDRRGSWCMGEACDIIGLVASCEVEASVLLTLKAIENVNFIYKHGYSKVLKLFPLVKEPAPYPPGPAAVGPGVLEALAKLFKEAGSLASQGATTELVNLKFEVRRSQEVLANASLTDLLRTSPSLKAPRLLTRLLCWVRRRPLPVLSDVSAVVRGQLDLVRALPVVATLSVGGDVVLIRTDRLPIRDSEKGTVRLLGPFSITLDVGRGEATVWSDDPLIIGSVSRHAPHVDDADGSISATPLSLALPELLGSLQLETAARMVLEYLTEFSGSRVPTAWLREWRKRDR